MAFDPNTLRKSYGNLTLTGVRERQRVERTGKTYTERWAQVRCLCGNTFDVLLSRWRSQPPSNCQKCAIKNAKRAGWHGFRARKTLTVSP